ncbi:hypothetical protein [Shewanella donghaensis]|uniref:hypothetical protein n=1 Tax=Shewanella donghaensis TaxID=238836 RepID=UPI001181F795|nr:hypothetical protein [Shewanella donghaensis]
MKLIINNIKWIMLISGLLTCSMILAVFAPEAALISMFGEALTEPVAQVVVRSWGFLIFLMGVLLIYGAFKPMYRNLSLVIVGLSKIVFVLLVLIFGAQYVEKAAVTLILDSIFITLFALYLSKVKSVS